MKPEIISYEVKADVNGNIGYQCSMSDKSIWTCDTDLKNWLKITPSLDELNEAFSKRGDNGKAGE